MKKDNVRTFKKPIFAIHEHDSLEALIVVFKDGEIQILDSDLKTKASHQSGNNGFVKSKKKNLNFHANIDNRKIIKQINRVVSLVPDGGFHEVNHLIHNRKFTWKAPHISTFILQHCGEHLHRKQPANFSRGCQFCHESRFPQIFATIFGVLLLFSGHKRS